MRKKVSDILERFKVRNALDKKDRKVCDRYVAELLSEEEVAASKLNFRLLRLNGKTKLLNKVKSKPLSDPSYLKKD